MNTLFENDMRTVNESELIYSMTQSKQIVMRHEEEQIDMRAILAAMTPGRREVAEAAIELYRRSIEAKSKRIAIKTPNDIYKVMRDLIGLLEVEEFWAIYLNQAGRIIKRIRISKGGIDGTYADVRIIIRYAIECNATQLVVCHNHPSGNTSPSRRDISLTSSIKKAAELMNIRLVDHMIICDENFYSFADEGAI